MKNVIDILKDSYSRNWITPRDGNISYKLEGAKEFYITPSGVRKQEINNSDFIQISMNNDGWEQLNNFNLKPSGEIELHYEILNSVTMEFFVVHLHPTYIISAMYSGLNLPDLVKDFPELSRYTKVANNTDLVLPLSKDLAEQCKTNLSYNNESQNFNFDIVGIPNHGVVSIGKSIFEAYEHIERLEHISKIVLSSNKI